SRYPSHEIEASNVAVGADGTPIVAWTNNDGRMYADVGGHQSLIADHVADLGRSTDVDPALVATGDGGAVIAFTTDRPIKFQAWIAERRPGETAFGRPHLLGTSFELPTLLAERAGGPPSVWNNNGVVRGMTRPRGGSFGASVELGGDEASRVGAAIGADGRIVAAWEDYDRGLRVIQRPAGHTEFGKPVTLF